MSFPIQALSKLFRLLCFSQIIIWLAHAYAQAMEKLLDNLPFDLWAVCRHRSWTVLFSFSIRNGFSVSATLVQATWMSERARQFLLCVCFFCFSFFLSLVPVFSPCVWDFGAHVHGGRVTIRYGKAKKAGIQAASGGGGGNDNGVVDVPASMVNVIIILSVAAAAACCHHCRSGCR